MYFLKLTVSIKLVSTHIYVFESKKHVWTSSQLFFPKTKAIQLKTSMFFIIVDIDSRYLKMVNSKCNMYITHRL